MSRPFENRKRIVAHVLPETQAAIAKKKKGATNTIGKVLDAQFAKKKPTRKKNV